MFILQDQVLMGFMWYLENRIYYKLVSIFRKAYTGVPDAKLSDISVIHETPNYIFVNKRFDVLINNSDKSKITVETQLKPIFPQLVNKNLEFSFYFTHRLDYSTSGVMCIAKTKFACAESNRAFSERKVKKYYLAIVRGHISTDFLTIKESVGNDIRPLYFRVKMTLKNTPYCSKETKDAETKLIVLERGICQDYPATKILLMPKTGRRHQLRLHCNHIGHTIVGDFTYSNKKDIKPYRMYLHVCKTGLELYTTLRLLVKQVVKVLMYLHALKINIPTRFENLDVSTPDPFTEDVEINKWKSYERVKSIEEAYLFLQNENEQEIMNQSNDLNHDITNYYYDNQLNNAASNLPLEIENR